MFEPVRPIKNILALQSIRYTEILQQKAVRDPRGQSPDNYYAAT